MKKITLLFAAVFTVTLISAQIPNLTFTQNFDYPANDPQDGSAGSVLDPNNSTLYNGFYNIPYIAVTSLNAIPVASGTATMFRVFIPPYINKISISINGPDGLANQFMRIAVIGENTVSSPTPTSYTQGDLLDNQWRWLSASGNYVYTRNSAFHTTESEAYLVIYNGQNVDANFDGVPEGDYPQTLTLGSFTMSWSALQADGQGYVDWANGITTGIELLEESSYSVYPNPTTDVLNINGYGRINQIKIMDVTGKNIFTKNDNLQNKINVSYFKAGIYFIEISTDNGVEIKKFLKK